MAGRSTEAALFPITRTTVRNIGGQYQARIDESYLHDAYGNRYRTQTSYNDGRVDVVSTQFRNDEDHWILGLPTLSTVSSTRGAATTSQSTRYGYYEDVLPGHALANKGRLPAYALGPLYARADNPVRSRKKMERASGPTVPTSLYKLSRDGLQREWHERRKALDEIPG